jgi:hypothetical protein
MAERHPENIGAQVRQQGVRVRHIPFDPIPHLPEMLIQGRERALWELRIKAGTWNPNAISPEALDAWIACLTAPGGLEGCLETYRAGLADAAIDRRLMPETPSLPILTDGRSGLTLPQARGSTVQMAFASRWPGRARPPC